METVQKIKIKMLELLLHTLLAMCYSATIGSNVMATACVVKYVLCNYADDDLQFAAVAVTPSSIQTLTCGANGESHIRNEMLCMFS